MEKRLTNQQIEQLFDFTKKHYVEHYDVQVELVDHLANAIEDQWKENPNILFEDALQTEFKKFGIFGFTGLVEQKQAELHKQYNKMLWSEVLKFISIPKVIITVAMYLLIFFFLKKTGSFGEIVMFSLILGSFLCYSIISFIFIYKIKKQQKNQGKKWLIQSVTQALFSLPLIGAGGYYQMINSFFEKQFELSFIGLHFLTAFSLLQFICIYVLHRIIKPRLLQSIQETEKRFQFV